MANTPGPWTLQPIGDETECNILGKGRELVATVSDNDARLIAEAPAMLEELRYSADSPHDYGRYPRQHSDEQAKYCRTCRAIAILARVDGKAKA